MMNVFSNYDMNKKFISPEHFLFLLKDFKNIYNFKIIKTHFNYLINDKIIEDCYLSTIIYQYILSKKNNRSFIYNNIFYLDTKNDHVFLNYIIKNNIDCNGIIKNNIDCNGIIKNNNDYNGIIKNNIDYNGINIDNINLNNDNEYNFIKKFYNIFSFPISIKYNILN